MNFKPAFLLLMGTGTIACLTSLPALDLPATLTSGPAARGGAVRAASSAAGAGIATAYAEGREIRVSSEGSVSVDVSGSTAKVAIGGQAVTVEKSRVLLDGRSLGDVPPETKKIEISMDKGMLFITGDGRELARAKMDK